jgi:hypothetical protein
MMRNFFGEEDFREILKRGLLVRDYHDSAINLANLLISTHKKEGTAYNLITDIIIRESRYVLHPMEFKSIINKDSLIEVQNVSIDQIVNNIKEYFRYNSNLEIDRESLLPEGISSINITREEEEIKITYTTSDSERIFDLSFNHDGDIDSSLITNMIDDEVIKVLLNPINEILKEIKKTKIDKRKEVQVPNMPEKWRNSNNKEEGYENKNLANYDITRNNPAFSEHLPNGNIIVETDEESGDLVLIENDLDQSELQIIEDTIEEIKKGNPKHLQNLLSPRIVTDKKLYSARGRRNIRIIFHYDSTEKTYKLVAAIKKRSDEIDYLRRIDKLINIL